MTKIGTKPAVIAPQSHQVWRSRFGDQCLRRRYDGPGR